MTQSKKLISKRGAISFERVIDSKGKVTGYLVGGQRYARYAEALIQFRAALNSRNHLKKL